VQQQQQRQKKASSMTAYKTLDECLKCFTRWTRNRHERCSLDDGQTGRRDGEIPQTDREESSRLHVGRADRQIPPPPESQPEDFDLSPSSLPGRRRERRDSAEKVHRLLLFFPSSSSSSEVIEDRVSSSVVPRALS